MDVLRKTGGRHSDGHIPLRTRWVWAEIKRPGDRRFWSMFPLTGVPFIWEPIFDTQVRSPNIHQASFIPTGAGSRPSVKIVGGQFGRDMDEFKISRQALGDEPKSFILTG